MAHRPSERTIRALAASQVRIARRYIRIEQEHNFKNYHTGTLAFLRGIIYGVGNTAFRRVLRATDRSWWTLDYRRLEHSEHTSHDERLAPVQ